MKIREITSTEGGMQTFLDTIASVSREEIPETRGRLLDFAESDLKNLILTIDRRIAVMQADGDQVLMARIVREKIEEFLRTSARMAVTN